MSRINIAFILRGALGTVLARANFVQCFYNKFSYLNMKIDIYGHPNPVINHAIMSGMDFVHAIYTRDMNIPYKKYDIAVIIDAFPIIKSFNKKKVKAADEKLFRVINSWDEFQKNPANKLQYEELRYMKPYFYMRSIINHKTVLDSPDLFNDLDIGGEYSLNLRFDKNENEVLENFGLANKKYITLQYGSHIKTDLAPKLWPLGNFASLAYLLKKKYPDILLVQLGEGDIVIDGTDLTLLNQTDLEDLKILLKNAYLHIDCECGMVHLRKALKTGPSIVLFGQTPMEFFGYEGNINIQGKGCCHWCAELTEDWEKRCIVSGCGLSQCMQNITPEYVLKQIKKYTQTEEIKPNTRHVNKLQDLMNDKRYVIDKEWYDNWLCNTVIYHYDEIKIKLRDLYFHKFTKNGWEYKPLPGAPVYKFLQGDYETLEKYNRLRTEYDPSFIHTEDRINDLYKHLDSSSYDKRHIIVVDTSNHILDGIHRACWLMHQKGEDATVNVLRIYRKE